MESDDSYSIGEEESDNSFTQVSLSHIIDNDEDDSVVEISQQNNNNNNNNPIKVNNYTITLNAIKNTKKIFEGNYIIEEHYLGPRIECKYCFAELFIGELTTTRICCLKNKIKLKPKEIPPEDSPEFKIYQLWVGNSTDSKLLRKFSRQINNSLAIASQVVTEEKSSGYNPTVTFMGRLYHKIGSLKQLGFEKPRFAQIYFNDPQYQEESDIRIGWMQLPSSTTLIEKEALRALITSFQTTIKTCNRIRHYLKICNIFKHM